MSLLQQYADEVATFVQVCHTLSERMYVTGYGGNLAWKLEEDVVLISPTQMNKGDIQPADVVFIRLDGTRLEGARRPTGETPMYVSPGLHECLRDHQGEELADAAPVSGDDH